MANQNGHGGARTPANPAAVSGPGALSRRTDGKQPKMQLPDAGYGEQAQFQADQGGAPMPQVGLPGPSPSGGPQSPPTGALGASAGTPSDMPVPSPLSAGSLRPGEPVTSGANAGPGPDASSLKLPDPTAGQHASALAIVQGLAASPTASPATRFLATSLAGRF